jgi:hypothetical protein
MRRLIPASVAVFVLLAGCSGGDDPEPKLAPTDSSSAASTTAPPPTPTPTRPVEPSLPSEAQGEDAAAAEAFVRFYWEMVNYAQATGDSQALARQSSDSCVGCQAAIELVSEVYGSGGSILGGESTVSNVESRELRAGNKVIFEVLFDVTSTPQEVDRSGTRNDETYPGTTVRDRFMVFSEDDALKVGRWELAP